MKKWLLVCLLGSPLIIPASDFAGSQSCQEVNVCSDTFSRSHSALPGFAVGCDAKCLWKRAAADEVKKAASRRFPDASIDGSLQCDVERMDWKHRCWFSFPNRKCRATGRACMRVWLCGGLIRGVCEGQPIRVRRENGPSQEPLWCKEKHGSIYTRTSPQCTTVYSIHKVQGWEARVVRRWENEWGRRWASFSQRTFWCKDRRFGRITCEICACITPN